MAQINENFQLAAEMAAISAVKSEDIVRLAKDTGDLDLFQQRLDDSKDRVTMVKSVLEETEPHEVTPELAAAMDNQLVRSEVTIQPADGLDVVEGAEALGISLMPKDYLFTRLVGCENFLVDFFRKSREVVTHLGSSFKDAYVVFSQNQDTMRDAIDLLEKGIEATPQFEGNETIILGARLFNLFKINDKVSEDWTGDVSKLSRSIAGISSNYYLNSKNMLNATLSYFGGFSGNTQEQGLERFLLLPVSIPSERFKDCSYPNKDFTTANITARQSVELMGGAYFLDCRQTKPNFATKTEDEVDDYLRIFLEKEYTSFQTSDETIFPKLGNEIKTLSSGQIKAITLHLNVLLKEWAKAFDAGEKFKMVDNDYNDIVKGIYESQLDEDLKDQILTAFSSIVRKNQMELLFMRGMVTNYLSLVINGLIELANMSVKANTP